MATKVNNIDNAGATSDLSIYLEGTNGSDTNDGLSEATALKTISAALNLIKNNYNKKKYGSITVTFLDGEFDFPKAISPMCTNIRNLNICICKNNQTGASVTFNLTQNTSINFANCNNVVIYSADGINTRTITFNHNNYTLNIYDADNINVSTTVGIRIGYGTWIYNGVTEGASGNIYCWNRIRIQDTYGKMNKGLIMRAYYYGILTYVSTNGGTQNAQYFKATYAGLIIASGTVKDTNATVENGGICFINGTQITQL